MAMCYHNDEMTHKVLSFATKFRTKQNECQMGSLSGLRYSVAILCSNKPLFEERLTNFI